MQLEQLELETYNSSAIEPLMNPSIETGLYFYKNYNSGLTISAPHNEPCRNQSDLNQMSYKIAQKITATEIINYDNFIPKNNIQHILYSLKDGKIIEHYLEEEDNNYALIFNTAKALLTEFDTLIIAEAHPKISRIVTYESGNYTPFEKSNVAYDTFIYQSRANTFSNLIPKETYDGLDRRAIESRFPIGYATLFIAQRIALFSNGKVKLFNEHLKSSESIILFSRNRSVENFSSYEDALSYCQEQNNKDEYGCEFLITVLVSRISWH